ncbi:hypothetical protein Taro_035531 [Colocasia esculenta]|uniref:GDSL esterase/lipase n=1 Tax=Colocasia esculenta TaxID=4460 RepID=A0A843VZ75_COLES|nr:hypothetical protein [Colocasia esculenta]
MAPPVFLTFLLFSAMLCCHRRVAAAASGASKFSALLVFGDSTVDTGNNNYISTPFAGNHPPYGQDLDGGAPTGRFSNGLLVPDFLVAALGIKQRCPPFLDPSLSDADVLTGIDFASAGSGYDDVTTSVSGVIPMSKQLEMFRSYLGRLEQVAGAKKKATEIVKGALILISAGTNDFVLNYYDIPTRRIQYTMDQYQDFLLQQVKGVIKQVYDLGGRRFAIAGLPPIGCTPAQMTAQRSQLSERVCVDEENANSVAYNGKLQALLAELSVSLPEGKIAYVNVYDPLLNMSTLPHNYGLEETKRGCCGLGYVESGPLCNRLSPICSDASKYMFFDAIHPTENVYRILTKQIVDEVVPKLY